MRKYAVGVLLCLFTLIVPIAPANATFPGDNGQIAFRRYLNTERTWGAIFTVRPDGTGERQVTHPPKGLVDRSPDVSPDGRRIVFHREAFDCGDDCMVADIFVVDVDGSHLRQLTGRSYPRGNCQPGGECNWYPAWSPDGKQIAFARAFGPETDGLIESLGIFVMRADGSHVRQLTQKQAPRLGEDTEPQFSPDGRMLVFQRWNVRTAPNVGTSALWTLNLVTGAERQITPSDLNAGDNADWSPDGKRILFHDNAGHPERSANLFTVRPDGSGLKQLTFANDAVTQYLGSTYSPDGKWIVFGRTPATGGPELNVADIFIMRVDGTRERPVTRTVLWESYADWGPAPCPGKGQHHH